MATLESMYLQSQIPQELINTNNSIGSSFMSASYNNSQTYVNMERKKLQVSATAEASAAAKQPHFELSLTSTSDTNNTLKSYSIIDGLSAGIDVASSKSGGFINTDSSSSDFRENNMLELGYSDAQQPIFDFGMPRNLTGRTGHAEASIKCKVDKLHDKSVSKM